MSEGVDLKHLPDSYVLPKANWRIALILGAAMAILLASFALAADREPAAWLPVVLFAVCFVTLIAAMFTRSSIILDRDGFTYQWLFGGKRHAWRDVSDFAPRYAGRSRLIVFNDATKVDTPFSRLNRTLRGGYNSSVTAAFVGGKLEDACAIMNAFRERSLRRTA